MKDQKVSLNIEGLEEEVRRLVRKEVGHIKCPEEPAVPAEDWNACRSIPELHSWWQHWEEPVIKACIMKVNNGLIPSVTWIANAHGPLDGPEDELDFPLGVKNTTFVDEFLDQWEPNKEATKHLKVKTPSACEAWRSKDSGEVVTVLFTQNGDVHYRSYNVPHQIMSIDDFVEEFEFVDPNEKPFDYSNASVEELVDKVPTPKHKKCSQDMEILVGQVWRSLAHWYEVKVYDVWDYSVKIIDLNSMNMWTLNRDSFLRAYEKVCDAGEEPKKYERSVKFEWKNRHTNHFSIYHDDNGKLLSITIQKFHHEDTPWEASVLVRKGKGEYLYKNWASTAKEASLRAYEFLREIKWEPHENMKVEETG
jgi:hypothetical protein